MKICLYDSGIGIIPFLKVILKKKIYNDYYLYIDNDNFPYGNKSDEELLKILKKVIKYVENNDFDYLFICCNTISRIFLNNQIESKVKVKTILEENIKDNKEFKLLCTPSLSKNIDNSINGNNLAEYITDNNLYKIIELINCIKNEKIILACTHYHLIKDLLDVFKVSYLSNEEQIFNDIESSKELNIYVKEKDYLEIKKYIKVGIKIY
jgi:glutamate racemase